MKNRCFVVITCLMLGSLLGILSCNNSPEQNWTFHIPSEKNIFPTIYYPIPVDSATDIAHVHILGSLKTPLTIELIRLTCQSIHDSSFMGLDSTSLIINLHKGHQNEKLEFEPWLGYGFSYKIIGHRKEAQLKVSIDFM